MSFDQICAIVLLTITLPIVFALAWKLLQISLEERDTLAQITWRKVLRLAGLSGVFALVLAIVLPWTASALWGIFLTYLVSVMIVKQKVEWYLHN